jgi:hypothetical protein
LTTCISCSTGRRLLSNVVLGLGWIRNRFYVRRFIWWLDPKCGKCIVTTVIY